MLALVNVMCASSLNTVKEMNESCRVLSTIVRRISTPFFTLPRIELPHSTKYVRAYNAFSGSPIPTSVHRSQVSVRTESVRTARTVSVLTAPHSDRRDALSSSSSDGCHHYETINQQQ